MNGNQSKLSQKILHQSYTGTSMTRVAEVRCKHHITAVKLWYNEADIGYPLNLPDDNPIVSLPPSAILQVPEPVLSVSPSAHPPYTAVKSPPNNSSKEATPKRSAMMKRPEPNQQIQHQC